MEMDESCTESVFQVARIREKEPVQAELRAKLEKGEDDPARRDEQAQKRVFAEPSRHQGRLRAGRLPVKARAGRVVPMSLVIGLFVGGRGTRFGGVSKGNLRAPSGERIAERLVGVCRTALPNVPIVLVGEASAYVELGLSSVADEPAGIGPLGGLQALLVHAEASGANGVLTLACDLPYVGAELVARLSREAPDAWLLAPREGDLWHTMFARYLTAALPAVRETIASGDRALQRVAARLGEHAVSLSLDASEWAELRDWDTPEDVSQR
jgi:molybdopterin-guanine dinucleotide biosynthesis protein A